MVFNKLKQLKQLRDQAMVIKRELAGEKVAIEENGVKVVIAGDQKIEVLAIDGKQDARVLKAINKAIKKSQKVAAEKLAQLSGGLSGLLK